MRFALLAVAATFLLAACGDPPTVEVTKLSADRFRLSVVAPGVVQGQRLLDPEAERLCGRKVVAAKAPQLGDGSTVVQEIACARPVPQRGLAASVGGKPAPRTSP